MQVQHWCLPPMPAMLGEPHEDSPDHVRQVIFQAPGQLEWREVPDPRLQGPQEALVRPLVVGRCDSVLVTSGACPVISLYAAALAVGQGAQRVDYVDADPERRRIATSCGAHAFEQIAAAPGSYDIVVDGASDPATLIAAFAACAPDASVTSIAPPLVAPQLQMMAMYHKGVTWRIARPDCRAGHASVLHAWSSNIFHPELVAPKLFAFDAAIEAWRDPALYVAVTLEPAPQP